MVTFTKLYFDYVHAVKSDAVNIDATFRCPLQCPCCVRQKENADVMITESRDMPIEDFKKLINFWHTFNICGQISDPIYHLKFLDLMQIMHDNQDKRFRIHTTATRKKIDWWKKAFSLSKQNVRWTFGLDGTDQETSNKYRINTNHNEVMDVMKLAKDMDVNCEWQFIVFKHNEHQIDTAKKVAKDMGISFKLLKSNRWDEEIIQKYKLEKPSDKYFSDQTSFPQRVYFR